MLVVGDKIKQVSPICGFDKVGETFDVIGIDDGAISFKADFGVGVMSWDEFKNHFEKYIEKERKKLPWTYWIAGKDDAHNLYLYKTNCNKVVVKEDGIKAESCCHPLDLFDLTVGLNIALARIAVKKAKINLYKAENKLNDILKFV